MHQLRCFIDMLIRPKVALASLPSDRLYLLSFLVAAYFAYARALRTGALSQLRVRFDSPVAPYLIFIVAIVVAFPLGGLLIKGICRLFGKRVSLHRVLNLIGYAQVPRIVIALCASIIISLLPDDIKGRLLLGLYPNVSLALSIGGILLLLYALIPFLWGLALTPNVERP